MPYRPDSSGRILLAPLLLAGSVWSGPERPPALPDDVRARVDAIFAPVDRRDSPGCALAVIRDGEIVYGRGYGMANLEHGAPITGATVFDIGSTSKQFTALSVLLLARKGKLSLDDDVRRHVPEMPDYGRPVTIRHLLHHTSGIRDYLELMSLAGWRFDDVSTDEDALGLIGRQKALNFEPGAEHLYSNSGYFLLSVIVKRATGKSLREFAQEAIFGPLGMKDTHFHDDHTMIVPNRATGYSPREGGGFRIEMSNFEQTGDGSVYATVEDLLLWDRSFYEPKLGDRALVEQMQQPGTLADGKLLDYAFGLRVEEYRGLRLVGHGGAWAGYRADLIRFPETRVSVACLCNLSRANPSRLARRVADVVLEEELRAAEARAAPAPGPTARGKKPEAAAPRLSPRELEERAGTYRDPKTGRVRKVVLREGRLFVEAFGGSYALEPVSRNTFRLLDAPVELEIAFEPAAGGAPRRMRESVEGRGEPVVREVIEPVTLDAAELAAHAGSYESDELLASYTLEVVEATLTLRRRNARAEPLVPTIRDEFNAGGLVLRFRRDGRGWVTGFGLDSGRIRDIRFEKRGGPRAASDAP